MEGDRERVGEESLWGEIRRGVHVVKSDVIGKVHE